MLIERVEALAAEHWREAVAQARTRRRMLHYGLGLLLAVGRKTVTSSILARDLGGVDWSADYKVFSRSPWSPSKLFGPATSCFLEAFPDGPIPIALDETKSKKTGTRIPHVSWQRDPLSPPFATNFIRAQRFLQASLLFQHHRTHELPARGIPVGFEHAPALKRPGARASDDEKAEYRRARKETNLSTQALAMMRRVRTSFDEKGASERPIVYALDGSFCNKTIFTADLDRIALVARVRRDARLCFPAAEQSRKWYDANTFTPDQVRNDESIPWAEQEFRLGYPLHKVRFKEVSGVLWRTGAKRRPLRLIVLAPQPYLVRSTSRSYRQPAYLLTTDLDTPVATLIQIYIDRWQIEVNHREEKDLLGLGQVQAWSRLGAERHPAFTVALYSLVLTATLLEFGPTRTDAFSSLPRWRRSSPRPSLLDLLRLLRRECNEARNSIVYHPTAARTLALAANA